MRSLGWLAVTAALAVTALPRQAAADSMDPALARLVKNEDCRAPGPDGTGAYYNPAAIFRCGTDDAAFAKLVSQYGGAVAPTAMHTAGTTGYGGFELAVELALTKIDSDADYWKNGTQGGQQENTGIFSQSNPNPDSVLTTYMLKLRKGLPLGFEIVGNVGFMGNTSFVISGADVRWSLLEGFRTGVPGVFPEIAVGGTVRTAAGTDEMKLTVGGFEANISKELPIGGTVQLTPYVGYQWLRIFGDSGQIDLTPNTDALDLCNYQGPNTPPTPDPDKQGSNGDQVHDGQPSCAGGTSDDFNNNVVFDKVEMTRHRIDFGAQLRFEYIRLGAHFITDVVDPKDANKGEDFEDSDTGDNIFEGVPKQWTLAFDLGAVF